MIATRLVVSMFAAGALVSLCGATILKEEKSQNQRSILTWPSYPNFVFDTLASLVLNALSVQGKAAKYYLPNGNGKYPFKAGSATKQATFDTSNALATNLASFQRARQVLFYQNSRLMGGTFSVSNVDVTFNYKLNIPSQGIAPGESASGSCSRTADKIFMTVWFNTDTNGIPTSIKQATYKVGKKQKMKVTGLNGKKYASGMNEIMETASAKIFEEVLKTAIYPRLNSQLANIGQE